MQPHGFNKRIYNQLSAVELTNRLPLKTSQILLRINGENWCIYCRDMSLTARTLIATVAYRLQYIHTQTVSPPTCLTGFACLVYPFVCMPKCLFDIDSTVLTIILGGSYQDCVSESSVRVPIGLQVCRLHFAFFHMHLQMFANSHRMQFINASL